MTEAGRITASGEASIPASSEVWTLGQHPAVSVGWIVRPVLFGSRVRVLPEWEGGHVIIKSEADARLIAAAPDLLEALGRIAALKPAAANALTARDLHLTVAAIAEAAIAKATRVADSASDKLGGYPEGMNP